MMLAEVHTPERILADKEAIAAINSALSRLDPKLRNVLEARFGFEDNPKTLRQLAREYGVSVERIRQIEQKALRKLKHPGTLKPIRDAAFAITKPRDPPDRLTYWTIKERPPAPVIEPPEPYSDWLALLRKEPRLTEIGLWNYWDFKWTFDIGLTPSAAVEFAIKFNECTTQEQRDKLCRAADAKLIDGEVVK